MSKLISGGPSNPFLPELCNAIANSNDIALAVAFIKVTGLRLLRDDLLSALSRPSPATAGPTEEKPNASVEDGRAVYSVAQRTSRVRILTSDYLDVTDPEALRLLMLLAQRGADVRVFETTGASFHLKAYLFASYQHGQLIHGSAFVGSSNISQQALTDGLEWNYRVDHPGESGYLETWDQFDELFDDPRAVLYPSDAWIEAYEARRIPPPRPIAPGTHEVEPPPTPTAIQEEALQALKKTRSAGLSRGLVVLATGLGKTWLAAFDANRFGAQRVLFVAHREEILNQAAETFARIQPHARVGFYIGRHRDVEANVLCASVQTLRKRSAPGTLRRGSLRLHRRRRIPSRRGADLPPPARALRRSVLTRTHSNARSYRSIEHPLALRRKPGLHPRPIRRR